MTTWNRIVVLTKDHGLVETRCPDWCTGDGHADGGFRADINHIGSPTSIEIQSPRGLIELVSLYLFQKPFAESTSRAVEIVVCLAGGESWETDAPGADWMASELVNGARRLRPAVRDLDALRGGEGQ